MHFVKAISALSLLLNVATAFTPNAAFGVAQKGALSMSSVVEPETDDIAEISVDKLRYVVCGRNG
jgi:hypothetical protein